MIMAGTIVEQSTIYSPDIIVMLVGALHLNGLQSYIKELSAEVNILSFAPKPAIGFFFPQILNYILKENGYFYSASDKSLEQARTQIDQFIMPVSKLQYSLE
jgi:hypothetical protein